MSGHSKRTTKGIRRGAALALGALIATAAIGCGRTSPPDRGEPGADGFVLPVPVRGYISGRPASRWEEGHISGNGTMGALIMGLPLDETIVLTHEKLFLPWEKPTPPVNTAARLREIRELLAEGRFQQAADFIVDLAKAEGYGPKRWTDPFIPAFDLRLRMEARGTIRGYGRTVNFATGEASVGWKDDRGVFIRKLFVSRPDNIVVCSIKGPGPRKLSCRIGLETRPVSAPSGIDTEYWNPEQKFREGIKDVAVAASGTRLTYRSSFKRAWPGGLQGYEGMADVAANGGSVSADGKDIVVQDADEILVLVRIDLFDDFANSDPPETAKTLETLAAKGYAGLLAPHVKTHGGIFGRVRLDLGGTMGDHITPSEGLVAASRTGSVNKARLEKEFDYGRYAILSSCGEWPPNLQGVWTGTWGAPWSGDYTNNGNLQSALAGALPANMPECMESLFRYMDFLMPGMKANAQRLYGARGILLPSRSSSHGYNNHFDATWPMTFWTAGAAWMAQFYYDYWLYTGDRKFLAEKAVPFMREAALFLEDFLVEGKDGKYVFSPSYSPENEAGNTHAQASTNATMDIALSKELLRNLITACEELKSDAESVKRWQAMLEKMPDYRINKDGAVAEWADPRLEDNDAHRHASHLAGLFDWMPPDVRKDPALLAAFRTAVERKMVWRRSEERREMAFGLVQLGLAATTLRDAKTASEIIDWLVSDYWTPALTSTHEPGSVFNTDICGGLPAVVIKAILYTEPGLLDLLPALPADWPQGSIEGLPTRCRILVKKLAWDGKRIELTLNSAKDQTIVLRTPGPIEAMDVVRGSAAIGDAAAGDSAEDRRRLTLPALQDVTLELLLK
ncbi:MAG: glycosyl hydrolase family 95 catalytic domain-containing protein [Candidatus Aminicenantales bacterium]